MNISPIVFSFFACSIIVGCTPVQPIEGTSSTEAYPYSSQAAPGDNQARGTHLSEHQPQTFDGHIAEAIEQYGRFRVIELRVTQAPRGSDRELLFDEVRFLRKAVNTPDAFGEIQNGVGRFVIAPLEDLQVLTARIDFGSVTLIDQRQRIVFVAWEQ